MRALLPGTRSRLGPAGALLPGLELLARGRWIPGLGRLVLVALVAWALASGMESPSGPGPRRGPPVDAVLAWCWWTGLVVVLWLGAWRRARGRTDLAPGLRSRVRRSLEESPAGQLGLYGVVILATLVALTPLIAPHPPSALDVGPPSHPPAWAWPMGTDVFGRDVLSRVLYGGRISLAIGLVAVLIASTIGTAIGAVAGYAGGWLDRALMWVVDLALSLPRLVLLLAIVGMFDFTGARSVVLIVAVLGLTGWMGVSRIVRSQVLSLREQEFVQAARALGMGWARIVFRHLVPNATAPVIVFSSLAVGTTILAEAGLSFLGLGVPAPTPTWGTLVQDGWVPLRSAPWIATFPGLAIVAAVMAFNLLGDGLRDALDPRMRRPPPA